MGDRKKIPVEVSNRHIHLSRKDIDALFGEDYQLKIARELSQPGQFAAEERVHLMNGDKRIENVRVLGPERGETQVELTKTDAMHLGIDVPLRDSGDIEETPGICVEGSKGNVSLNKGVIIAKKHLHASEEEAKELGIKDRDIINVKITGGNPLIFENILVRVHPNYRLAVHIDRDDGDSANISRVNFGEII